MIMFRECLKNNLMPFIILDNNKSFYLSYKTNKMFLIDTIKYEQDNYEKIINEMLNFVLENK
jgi:hypothetical protein